MNKLKLTILKVLAWSLKNCIRLLSLIGFSFLVSCTKFNDPVVMYGVPYPDNNINFKGNVKSEDTHNPIPGIKIKLTTEANDTLYTSTDQLGNYSLWKYAMENQNVKLILSDIDSTQNGGEFESKTVDIIVSFRDVNNSEHQANVLLKPKP